MSDAVSLELTEEQRKLMYDQFSEICGDMEKDPAIKEWIEKEGDKARAFAAKAKGMIDRRQGTAAAREVLSTPEGMIASYNQLCRVLEENKDVLAQDFDLFSVADPKEMDRVEKTLFAATAVGNDGVGLSTEHFKQCYSMGIQDFPGLYGNRSADEMITLESFAKGDKKLEKQYVLVKQGLENEAAKAKLEARLPSSGEVSPSVKAVKALEDEAAIKAAETGAKLEVALTERAGKTGGNSVTRTVAKADAKVNDGIRKIVEKGSKALNDNAVGRTYDKVSTTVQKKVVDPVKKPVKKVVKNVAKNVADTGAGKVAAVAVKKVAEKAAEKTTGKIVAKAVVKSALKKVPVVSAVAGVAFAAERVMNGDGVGACGELASGVAGCFPGVGTGISCAIDAALIGKDVHEAKKLAQAEKPAVKKTVAVKKPLTPEQKQQIAARANVKNNKKTNTTTAKKTQLTPAQMKSMGNTHSA